jgi:catechol 2,3-dioxygenase-like lactoylglutathione lyase family enzyme
MTLLYHCCDENVASNRGRGWQAPTAAGDEAMALGIFGIDHIQITVPAVQEDDCLHFYRKVLGLEEIDKPEELRRNGGAWFKVGALQLHIGLDPVGSPRSKRHICFLVDDLDSAKRAMVSLGVRVEQEGQAEGLRRFFIRDPADNRIEIGQR